MSEGQEIRWVASGERVSLSGYDMAGREVLEVYGCADGSWRVWFEHGVATDEFDDKLRNLQSLEEAKMLAERWYRKWADEGQPG